MPEYSEVKLMADVVRRELVGRSLGARGFTLGGVVQHGKQFALQFRNHPDSYLIRPAMTGHVILVEHGPGPLKEPYVRQWITINDHPRWAALLYCDQRRLGSARWITPDEWDRTRRSGVDVGDLTQGELVRLLETHPRMQVRSLLLNQDLVAGLGNVYTAEILHRVRTHPRTLCHNLNSFWAGWTVETIHQYCHETYELGGLSLGGGWGNFRNPYGEYGTAALTHMVYGRQECGTCQARVERRLQNRRPVYCCPACQRPGGWTGLIDTLEQLKEVLGG